MTLEDYQLHSKIDSKVLGKPQNSSSNGLKPYPKATNWIFLLVKIPNLKNRLTNVYDIDKRNYLFKFGNAEDKVMLHLEMGNRIHPAASAIEKKIVPSGLTMKLRKKLKGKRLESCKPVGVERVMEIKFGTGELEIRLYLEFYSKGNMILTDHELNIIAVTRSYAYDEENK